MSDKTKSEKDKFERWALKQFPDLDERLFKINEKYEYEDREILFMFIGFCGGVEIGRL